MRHYRLEHNERRLPWMVNACTGPAERARGLIGRSCAGHRTAWLIQPCGHVHTFGMRMAIDVLFCDAGWRVVELLDELGPWRVAGHPMARATWELPVGSIRTLGLRLGDRLRPC